MGKYIGIESPYGVFSVQDFASQSPNGVKTEFTLLFKVASAASILLVYNGIVLQPEIDYVLAPGGEKINFTDAPASGFSLYATYLGRELGVSNAEELDGDKGDILVSNNGSTWTLKNQVITYSRIQNLNPGVILGRKSTTSGVLEEIPSSSYMLQSNTGFLAQTTAQGARDVLGLGTAATQNAELITVQDVPGVNIIPRVERINTGDQNIFSTIAVSGQSNVTADTTSDTLTFISGNGINITTNATTDTITFSMSDGDKGDITVSGSGANLTIDNQAVTYAKMQHVSTTNRLLGRSSAGAGIVEEIICTSVGRNLIDDIDVAAQRNTLGLGSLATQFGTFSGVSSGTNTGDQNLFSTIAVSGQSNVSAQTTSDTLTFIAGENITITTDAIAKTVRIRAAGGEGTITLGSGTEALPSLSFSNVADSNTGMYRPAEDNIAFTTGGSERLRINSSGYVDIGLSSESERSPLTVYGLDSTWGTATFLDRTTFEQGVGGRISFSGFYNLNTYALFGQIAGIKENVTSGNYAGAISIRTNAGTTSDTNIREVVRIASTGNVSLIGQLLLPNGTNIAPSIRFTSDSSTGFYRSATDSISITTAGSERLIVNSAGRVGIGTASPNAILDVQAESANAVGINQRGRASDNNSIFRFTQSDGTTENARVSSTPSTLDINKAGINPITFTTNSIERARVSGDGNFGIGTTNPGARLDVNGTIRTSSEFAFSNTSPLIRTGTVDGTDNATLTITSAGASGSNRGSFIELRGNETSTNSGRLFLSGGTTASGHISLSANGRSVALIRGRNTDSGGTTSNSLIDIGALADFANSSNNSTVPTWINNLNTGGVRIVSNNSFDGNTRSNVDLISYVNSSSFRGYFYNTSNPSDPLSNPTAATSGNNLVQFIGGGYDGSALSDGANITIAAEANWTTGSRPTFISFGTSQTTSIAERMRITSTGRVGIGTTSPFAQLDVANSLQIGSSATATNNFYFTTDTSGFLRLCSGNFNTGTERLRFDNSGNLVVSTGGNTSSRLISTFSSSINTLFLSQNWNYSGSGSSDATGQGTASIGIESGPSGYSRIALFTNNTNSTPIERLAISNTGAVTISGNVSVTGTISATGTISGNFSGNSTNVTGIVAIVNGGTGANSLAGAKANLEIGSIASQSAGSVTLTGGTINGVVIGGTAPSTASFSNLSVVTNSTISSEQNATVTTSGSTPTVLYSLNLTDNTTYMFDASLAARRTSTSAKGCAGKLRFGVYRFGGGVATLVTDFSGALKEIDTYGSSGYDFNVSVSGNEVRIIVTGVVSEEVKWAGNVRFVQVS